MPDFKKSFQLFEVHVRLSRCAMELAGKEVLNEDRPHVSIVPCEAFVALFRRYTLGDTAWLNVL